MMGKFKKFFRRFLTILSPRLNTEILYYVKFKKKLNLKNPTTFNEKILWLKFNKYRNNELVKKCADKYCVVDFVKERGCADLLNRRIRVFETPEKIDWDKLPKQFALKLNVGAGKNIIVNDKSLFDESEVKKKFEKWMKEDYYLDYSEFQYKDVKKVILVEEYLGDVNGGWPEDYKIFCVDGCAKAIMTCVDRESRPKFFFLDTEWTLLPFTEDALNFANANIEKPEQLEKLISYAETLSYGFPFVRVDFFITNGKIYFGELTFTPTAGMDTLLLECGDKILGEIITCV